MVTYADMIGRATESATLHTELVLMHNIFSILVIRRRRIWALGMLLMHWEVSLSNERITY
jgi:hypothetical protein